MRIPIREQLAGLVLLASGIGLAVIAIATWYTNRNFVLQLRSTRLTLTASLKAAQLASNLNLIQNSAQFISSRVLIQNALRRYTLNNNNTAENWFNAQSDMAAAIGGGNTGGIGQALLLQTMVLPKNASGPAGQYSVLNATGANIPQVILPYTAPNGSQVRLGDIEYGYPPALYPNLTYTSAYVNETFSEAQAIYDGRLLTAPNSTLLLGPYHINSTFSLISITLPIINNTSASDVLGWLTVVCDARLIGDVTKSTEGLGDTGQTAIIGPTNRTNHFGDGVLWRAPNTSTPTTADNVGVRFIWPLSDSFEDRHPAAAGLANPPDFSLRDYPAVADGVLRDQMSINNAGSNLRARNEAGLRVSVGYAMPDTELVDWIVAVEQLQSEVWEPIIHLRRVLLACVFGTLGGMMLLAWPLAHFASAPIRRLREATRKSVIPLGYSESTYSRDSHDLGDDESPYTDGANDNSRSALARKEGFFPNVSGWSERRRMGKMDRRERKEEARRRQFRIPGKVHDRKHCAQDELTDLTRTFNEMSDELMMQYERLEERVKQRTAELERSEKAAEAANESKTLFIANISHELKTPLNGILGMCAVCMQEDDPIKLKRSLGIIYKSGDLLLDLLTDLLTFSKNQVGQQLSLDEKEFRLREISSQVLAIFDKQAKDGQITLRVDFLGTETSGIVMPGEEDRNDFGPFGTGRVKDMILWGDQHRILQVVINLVSNSLKFTPPGGTVVLTIRCMGESSDIASRKTSLTSRGSRQISSRHKNSDVSAVPRMHRRYEGTANEINPTNEKSTTFAHIMACERAGTPPSGRGLMFQFECKDTGPGIAEDFQQRIFEPFVQGDLALSKKFGGTGLGLSICSQLAKPMRGTIELESELGHGSTFTMNIPLKHLYSRSDSTASSVVGHGAGVENRHSQDGTLSPNRRSRYMSDDDSRRSVASHHSSRAPSPPLATGPAQESGSQYQRDSQPRLVGLSQPFFASNQPMESPGSQSAAIEKISKDVKGAGKIRVLVAEDNKINQEVVLRMLKLEDVYDVTVAKDGQEAVDFVKESMNKPFDLILMDIQMPRLDGLQSTRLIRGLGYEAPIVALTAFSEESNVKDCLDSGMNYFLSKPIRRPALKKVLKDYCPPIPEEEEVNPLEKAKLMPAQAQPQPQPQRTESPVPVVINGASTFLAQQHSRGNSLDNPITGSPMKGIQ